MPIRRRSTRRYATHRKRHYKGRGLYTGSGAYNFGKALTGRANKRLIAGVARGWMQNAIGAGGGIGPGTAGAGLYTGSGSYVANNLMVGHGLRNQNSVPSMTGLGDETGAFVIDHTEYIADLYAPGIQGGGAVAFTSQTFPLNPGLQNSFTFLSQLACNYDEYKFEQLIFEFRSTTTDIGVSATGQCGTVIMACNYNAASVPFPDKQTMMEYAHANSCKVTESMVYGVECDPKKSGLSASQLSVRSNPVVTGQDLKTYDHGLMQIGVANCPSAYNGYPIGEIWVKYRVRLAKPKLFVGRGFEVDAQAWYISSNLATLSATNWFGPNGNTNYLTTQQQNIGALISANNGVSITFPANYTGNLRCTIQITGTGFGNTVFAGEASQSGNIVSVNDLYPGAGASSFLYGTTPTSMLFTFDIYVSQATFGVNNIISFGSLAGSGITVTSAYIRLDQYQTLGGINQNMNNVNARVPWINAVGSVTIPT